MEATPKLETISQAVLFRLYERSLASEGLMDTEAISKAFQQKISSRQASLAIEILLEKKFARHPQPNKWVITKEGYLFVERALDDPSSLIRNFSNNGNEWLFDTGGHIPQAEELLPKDTNPIAQQGDSISGSELVLNPDATPQASTAITSMTFGVGSDNANFGNGNFASSGGEVRQNTLSADNIPAAGRYVSAKDNQPKIIEIRESVAELIEAIREDRTNDFDDKEGRLGELLAFDLLLQQPQISVPAVELILRDTVFFLAKTFAKSAINIAASKLWALAAPFFGIHM